MNIKNNYIVKKFINKNKINIHKFNIILMSCLNILFWFISFIIIYTPLSILLKYNNTFNYFTLEPISVKSYLLTKFHFILITILIFIFFTLILLVYYIFKNNIIYSRYLENLSIIEYVWTLLPGVILFIISIPSLSLLYEMEKSNYFNLTLKVNGNQWYWNYEISHKNNIIEIDQYQINDEDLLNGDIRLQEFDNWLWLPTEIAIRLLATSNDVIHSWSIPSLGIKLDCLPSRLNQDIFSIFKVGNIIGSCNELCGSLHPFMGIGIKSINHNIWNDIT